MPAPDQPDDPTWGSALRQPNAAAHNGLPDDLGEWVAQLIGALDKLECRLLVQRHNGDILTLIGRLDLPCTVNLTRLAWVDVTGDGQEELLLITIHPDDKAFGQTQRLHVYSTSNDTLIQVATLDGTINGADGVGIRWQQPAQSFNVQAGLPLIDPDTTLSLFSLRRARAFQTYRWDEGSQTFKLDKS